jgi:hypothetical protein
MLSGRYIRDNADELEKAQALHAFDFRPIKESLLPLYGGYRESELFHKILNNQSCVSDIYRGFYLQPWPLDEMYRYTKVCQIIRNGDQEAMKKYLREYHPFIDSTGDLFTLNLRYGTRLERIAVFGSVAPYSRIILNFSYDIYQQIKADLHGGQILLRYVPDLVGSVSENYFYNCASVTLSYSTALCMYARCKILEQFYNCNALSSIEDRIIFSMDFDLNCRKKEIEELLEMLRAQSRDCAVMIEVYRRCDNYTMVWNEICASIHMSTYTL